MNSKINVQLLAIAEKHNIKLELIEELFLLKELGNNVAYQNLLKEVKERSKNVSNSLHSRSTIPLGLSLASNDGRLHARK
jgi:hypothetical protein